MLCHCYKPYRWWGFLPFSLDTLVLALLSAGGRMFSVTCFQLCFSCWSITAGPLTFKGQSSAHLCAWVFAGGPSIEGNQGYLVIRLYLLWHCQKIFVFCYKSLLCVPRAPLVHHSLWEEKWKTAELCSISVLEGYRLKSPLITSPPFCGIGCPWCVACKILLVLFTK